LRYALRAVNVRRVVCGTNDGWYLGVLGLGHHQRAPAAWSQRLVKQELRLVAALIASQESKTRRPLTWIAGGDIS